MTQQTQPGAQGTQRPNERSTPLRETSGPNSNGHLKRLSGACRSNGRITELEARRSELLEEIESLESAAEADRDNEDLLAAQKKITQTELKRDRLERKRDTLTDDIADLESQLDDQAQLEARREEINTRLRNFVYISNVLNARQSRRSTSRWKQSLSCSILETSHEFGLNTDIQKRATR